jgi:hypothetical protein
MELVDLITQVKLLAKEYRKQTGKPLGVTGEVAEVSAANLLGLNLAPARTPGYDAIGLDGKKYQIKGRCRLEDSRTQMVGGIKLAYDWDAVLLVILDSDLEVIEIIEAQRPEIDAALSAPGSRARNERGFLAVSKFRSIGKTVWRRPITQILG